jgi:hypothetical protein
MKKTCLNCKEREYPVCYARCEAYQAMQAKKEIAHKNAKRESDITGMQIDNMHQWSKRR